MNRSFLSLAANLFPIWVILGGGLALWHPPLFLWIEKNYIIWGLAIIMLGMGMTLSWEDLRGVLKLPRAAGIGLFGQYLIMPALGYGIAWLGGLPVPLAVGLILVSCCPGGTASNVVAYIAKANIALSVLMTMCSTMLAIIMTPFLTAWLAGQYVPVDKWGLFVTTVQVVLLPVLIGIALHHGAPRLVKVVLPGAPLVAVLVIMLICANVIAKNAQQIMAAGEILLVSVFLLHSLGFGLGYGLSKLFGFERIINQTVSIEVGMQNSGLAVVLAGKHFADPLTAVPGAISAVFHSIIGSILAVIWRRQSKEKKSETKN